MNIPCTVVNVLKSIKTEEPLRDPKSKFGEKLCEMQGVLI